MIQIEIDKRAVQGIDDLFGGCSIVDPDDLGVVIESVQHQCQLKDGETFTSSTLSQNHSVVVGEGDWSNGSRENGTPSRLESKHTGRGLPCQ